MRNSIALLLSISLLLVVGCDSGTVAPDRSGAIAPEAAGTEATSSIQIRKAGSISAHGGASFIVPEDVFGAEVGNVLTFNAQKDADGSLGGQFNYHQTFMGETFKFNGPVTCFNVYDGNRAKIGGLVKLSNDVTLPPGVFIWWSVIDNGQGAGAPPDESTIIGAGDEAANEAFCDDPAVPRFGPWEIAGGNFQVDG
jgi:hypothetical protein